MDKFVIDKTNATNEFTFNQNSLIVIDEEVDCSNLKLNVCDCDVTIIDTSNINKTFNFNNCKATVVEIFKDSKVKKLEITNESSNVEYNIVDLVNEDVNYEINGNTLNAGNSSLNIASIGYKNHNKLYSIYTSNEDSYTTNLINCFGIVKDSSLVKYDVSSFIKKGAKKANVKQSSNILLFDKESKGENNPILLIEENDVKASHGSTIGKIDDDTLFYLCSRGLSKMEATNLICVGKIEYLLNKINDNELRDKIIEEFKERMR